MSVIDILAPHSHDILVFLSQDLIVDDNQANSEQLKEERCKARHLETYPLIREMEGYSFFKGAIRFLYTGSDNNEDWDNFVTKADNIKKLIPEKREERHTIKLITPYFSKQALCEIYFHHWVSNNNEHLRLILLDSKAAPFLHNFLLQNNVKDDLSLLHQDIIDLCEKAFGGTAYLQTRWGDGKYIWTNYERGTKNHGWNSYVVGNEVYKRISRILDESIIFEIYKEQKNRRIGNHIQATYIHFKYHDYNFTLYGNNTICLMTNNWEEKKPNPDDSNGFYFSVQEIKTEEQLVEQVKEMIAKYEKK